MVNPVLAIGLGVGVIVYLALQALLYGTQNKREPQLHETKIPFLGSAMGLMLGKDSYLVKLRNKSQLPIQTIRLPFQRVYLASGPSVIQDIQNKANVNTFVPNLLDFGLTFSGLDGDAGKKLTNGYGLKGNDFTKSVHKYLLSGPTLQAATITAVNRLSSSVLNCFADSSECGLAEILRHNLCLAMTGAVYGPENPYDDPSIESSWKDFVPGINHLLYSPVPPLTAWKALRGRARVIDAFRKYFAIGGHLQAFPMIAEMYENTKSYGLSASDAAKMEMATSLAMLSSGGVTAFWLMFHILSDAEVLKTVRQELLKITKTQSESESIVKILDLSLIKAKCPTLVAMLHETLRYHSTVINVKQVRHDTVLSKDKYLLKKDSIIMIPGKGVHHDVAIWGEDAGIFDHCRFLTTEGQKKLSSTLSFRPFGAGATMCPGRHFSLNSILSMTAMVLLQFDITPKSGKWTMPDKRNADMWNAMPKPDKDIKVAIAPRKELEEVGWKFVWGEAEDNVEMSV